MRKIHPGRFVTFLQPHVQVTPATVLESYSMSTGEPIPIAELPERRVEYTAGQTLEFGSVNAAKAFVKAINTERGEEVCRVGR